MALVCEATLFSDGANQARLLLKFLFEGQNKKDRSFLPGLMLTP